MKIAVIFDSISSEGGGNFYQSLQSALILNDLGEKNKDYKYEENQAKFTNSKKKDYKEEEKKAKVTKSKKKDDKEGVKEKKVTKSKEKDK